MEFFNRQAPDGLKSFGNALCMISISLGNYVSSLLTGCLGGFLGTLTGDIYLDIFYFRLVGLTLMDLEAYILCAKWYKSARLGNKFEEEDEEKLKVVVSQHANKIRRDPSCCFSELCIAFDWFGLVTWLGNFSALGSIYIAFDWFGLGMSFVEW
nr:protein NRT1/ PTR FAMILY 7.3 [Ipomoea batatas]